MNASYRKQLAPQVSDARELARSSRGHVALCTTFDAYKFTSRLHRGSHSPTGRRFRARAIAVKSGKRWHGNQRWQGKFIMPDDPKFAPIYETLPSTARP